MIEKFGSLRNGLGAYRAGETITNKRINDGKPTLSPAGERYADEILECSKRSALRAWKFQKGLN